MMVTLTLRMPLVALQTFKENCVSCFFMYNKTKNNNKKRLGKNYSVTLDNTLPRNTAILDQEKKIHSIPLPNQYVMGCSS